MIEAQNASRILAGVAAVSTSARKYANVGLDLAYEPPPVLVRVNLRITVSLASSFDCTAILQWSGEPLITVCERSLSETTLLIRVNSSEVRSQSCGTYSLSIDAEIVISSLYRASTPFELIYIYVWANPTAPGGLVSRAKFCPGSRPEVSSTPSC